MLDGWYCRSMANQSSIDPEDTQSQTHQNNHYQQQQQQQNQQNNLRMHMQSQNDGIGGGGGDSGSADDDDSHIAIGNAPNINQRVDFKGRYNNLKKKLKFLLYVSVKILCTWCCTEIINKIIFYVFTRKMNSFKMLCDRVNVVY